MGIHMLNKLEQALDKNGKVVFATPRPDYNSEDPETINTVINDLASNSSSLLLINFYTPSTKMYMSDTDIEASVKLVVSDGADFTRVLKALKNNTHLIELCLCGYTITGEQAKELGDVLAAHPSLQTLRLYHAKLSICANNFLAQGITKNKQIHSLYFGESQFEYGEHRIEQIVYSLKNNHFVTTVETTNAKCFINPQPGQNPPFVRTFPFRKEDINSINESMTRNQTFWKQRRALEERFIVLEELKIIPKDPKRDEYDLLLKRNKTGQSKNFSKEEIVSELTKKLLPNLGRRTKKPAPAEETEKLIYEQNASHSNTAFLENEDINQNLSESNILAIISVFDEMAAIVKDLKQKNFQAWRNLLERVKRAEAYFYLNTDQIILFFDLYRDYFKSPGNAEIDFQFAERILNYENTDENKHTLALLGLHNDRLRYQYVLKLLEGNLTPGAPRLRKSAYCKLHNLYDNLDVPSLEETIGVDRILTNYLLLLLLSSDVNRITDQSYHSYKCSTEFEAFYKFIQEYCKLGQTDKEKISDEKNKLLNEVKIPQEKAVAQILLDVSEGKKIALYSQLRQKKPNELVKTLGFTETDENGRPTLNLQEFNNAYPTLSNRQMDLIENQVHLKHTLAQNLGYSVYEAVFNLPSTQTITREHSRILSATRLATVSSDFSHEHMIKILQVEYAALPDSDKEGNLSFFTSYRHRTLEKALEAVFKKESISRIDGNVIKADENLSLAFAILQWIGDQERSFYYKISKNPTLFTAMQELGKIAHKMIACDNPEKALPDLKTEAKKELDKVSSIVDVTFPLSQNGVQKIL